MIIPIIAGIVQNISDSFHPQLSPVAKGILRPDDIAAKIPIVVELTLVIRATFNGYFSLMTPGNNTFQIAIPSPTIIVPKKRKEMTDVDRMNIPITSKSKPITMVRSFVHFTPNLGTIGEIIANARSGKLVNKPTLQFARPKSSRIIPSKGPTAVIPGRKFIAIIITPKKTNEK